MKNCVVRFSDVAVNNLSDSFEWGAERWGLTKAEAWLDEIQTKIEFHLSRTPLACPLAPEADDFDFEVRKLVLGRYRVIFSVNGGEVLILTIKGPYSNLSLK